MMFMLYYDILHNFYSSDMCLILRSISSPSKAKSYQPGNYRLRQPKLEGYREAPCDCVIEHLPCPSHGDKCDILKFPDHSPDLVLVWESPVDPPLPPGPLDLDVVVFPEHLEPLQGTGDWYISVYVPRVNPNPVPSLHQNGIHLIRCVLIHNIMFLHMVVTGVPSLNESESLEVQMHPDVGVVKELECAQSIVAVHVAPQRLSLQAKFPLLVPLQVLVITWGVDVQNRSVSFGEAVIQVRSKCPALL